MASRAAAAQCVLFCNKACCSEGSVMHICVAGSTIQLIVLKVNRKFMTWRRYNQLRLL